MKQYGANKATEFTRKQIGVIFSNAKRGNLKVEKWMMSEMYNLADYYGFDDNGTVEAEEKEIRSILDSVFAGDMEEAQKKIDALTEKEFAKLGRKYQEAANRAYVA